MLLVAMKSFPSYNSLSLYLKLTGAEKLLLIFTNYNISM